VSAASARPAQQPAALYAEVNAQPAGTAEIERAGADHAGEAQIAVVSAIVAGSGARPGVPPHALRLRLMRRVVPCTSTVTASSAWAEPRPIALDGGPTVSVTA
jgi:hypothetical protein